MIAAIAYGAVAFSPSPKAAPRASNKKMVALSKTEFCYGLPGNIAPAGDFDPANLLADKSKSDVMRLREAELTHGRVGMLAAAGFLVQENFHPLFNGINGPAIDQIPQLPPALWFAMTLGIGIAEATRIQVGWSNPYKEGVKKVQTLKDDYYLGDLGFDPLGLKPTDPAELRVMQEKELSHGRLAMLAAAGFMAQEAVTGATWGSRDVSFEKVILGGYFAQESAELARGAAAACASPPVELCHFCPCTG